VKTRIKHWATPLYCVSRYDIKEHHPAFSVENRVPVDDPLQKVDSSSPVVACKNTVMPLLCVARGRYGCREIVKGWL